MRNFISFLLLALLRINWFQLSRAEDDASARYLTGESAKPQFTFERNVTADTKYIVNVTASSFGVTGEPVSLTTRTPLAPLPPPRLVIPKTFQNTLTVNILPALDVDTDYAVTIWKSGSPENVITSTVKAVDTSDTVIRTSFSALTHGQQYLGDVRAVSEGRESIPLAFGPVVIAPSSVTEGNVEPSISSCVLTFDKAEGIVDSYHLFLYNTEELDNIIDGTVLYPQEEQNNMEYSFQNLSPETEYQISVITNSKGERSQPTNFVFQTESFPPPVGSISYSDGNSIIVDLIPQPSDQVQFYHVKLYLSRAVPVLVAEASVNAKSDILTHSFESLIPGELYSVSATSRSGEHESKPTEIGKLAIKPSLAIPTAVSTSTTASVSVNAVNDGVADYYNIYVYTKEDPITPIAYNGFNASLMPRSVYHHVFTNLNPDTGYLVRSRAQSYNITGDYTEVEVKTSAPEQPDGIISNVNNRSIIVTIIPPENSDLVNQTEFYYIYTNSTDVVDRLIQYEIPTNGSEPVEYEITDFYPGENYEISITSNVNGKEGTPKIIGYVPIEPELFLEANISSTHDTVTVSFKHVESKADYYRVFVARRTKPDDVLAVKKVIHEPGNITEVQFSEFLTSGTDYAVSVVTYSNGVHSVPLTFMDVTTDPIEGNRGKVFLTDQNTIKVVMNPLLYNFTNWTLALSIDESDEIIDVKYLDPTSSELTTVFDKGLIPGQNYKVSSMRKSFDGENFPTNFVGNVTLRPGIAETRKADPGYHDVNISVTVPEGISDTLRISVAPSDDLTDRQEEKLIDIKSSDLEKIMVSRNLTSNRTYTITVSVISKGVEGEQTHVNATTRMRDFPITGEVSTLKPYGARASFRVGQDSESALDSNEDLEFLVKLISITDQDEAIQSETVQYVEDTEYSVEFKDLTPGARYQLEVTAIESGNVVNTVGIGQINIEPAPVQTIDVEKEVTGLTVHFTETPGDKNYFLVSISEEGSLNTRIQEVYPTDELDEYEYLNSTFNDLKPGTEYIISVTAVSSTDIPSSPVTETVTLDLPPNSQVEIVNVTSTNIDVSLIPSDTLVEKFSVNIYNAEDLEVPIQSKSIDGAADNLITGFTDLTPGQNYVVVTTGSISDVGGHPVSVNVSTYPDQVQEASIKYNLDGVNVTFSKPKGITDSYKVTLTVIDDPEDVILQYEHVQISNEEDSITAEFLEDLIPGQNYSVSIVAVANDLKSDPVDIPFALVSPNLAGTTETSDTNLMVYVDVEEVSDYDIRLAIAKENSPAIFKIAQLKPGESKYTFPDLTSGQSYDVLMIPVINGKQGFETKLKDTLVPKPVKEGFVEVVNSVVTLEFKKPEGIVEEYEIDISTKSLPDTFIKKMTVTNPSDENMIKVTGDSLDPKGEYIFSVTSKSRDKRSEPVEFETKKIIVLPPKGIELVAMDSASVIVQIVPPEGPYDNFIVKAVPLVSSESDTLTESTEKTALILRDLISGESYDVEVKTIYNGIESKPIAEYIEISPAPVNNVSVEIGHNYFIVTFHPPTGLFDSFEVTLSPIDSAFVIVKTLNETNLNSDNNYQVLLTDERIQPETLYDFSITTLHKEKSSIANTFSYKTSKFLPVEGFVAKSHPNGTISVSLYGFIPKIGSYDVYYWPETNNDRVNVMTISFPTTKVFLPAENLSPGYKYVIEVAIGDQVLPIQTICTYPSAPVGGRLVEITNEFRPKISIILPLGSVEYFTVTLASADNVDNILESERVEASSEIEYLFRTKLDPGKKYVVNVYSVTCDLNSDPLVLQFSTDPLSAVTNLRLDYDDEQTPFLVFDPPEGIYEGFLITARPVSSDSEHLEFVTSELNPKLVNITSGERYFIEVKTVYGTSEGKPTKLRAIILPARTSSANTTTTPVSISVTFRKPVGKFELINVILSLANTSFGFVEEQYRSIAEDQNGYYNVEFQDFSITPETEYEIDIVTINEGQRSQPFTVSAVTKKLGNISKAEFVELDNTIAIRFQHLNHRVDHYLITVATYSSQNVEVQRRSLRPLQGDMVAHFKDLEYGQGYVFNITVFIGDISSETSRFSYSIAPQVIEAVTVEDVNLHNFKISFEPAEGTVETYIIQRALAENESNVIDTKAIDATINGTKPDKYFVEFDNVIPNATYKLFITSQSYGKESREPKGRIVRIPTLDRPTFIQVRRVDGENVLKVILVSSSHDEDHFEVDIRPDYIPSWEKPIQVKMLNLSEDGSAETQFENLEFGERYIIRAFGILKGYKSRPTISFGATDPLPVTDGIIITTANSFTFDFAPPSGVVNHYVIKYSKRLPPKRFRGELQINSTGTNERISVTVTNRTLIPGELYILRVISVSHGFRTMSEVFRFRIKLPPDVPMPDVYSTPNTITLEMIDPEEPIDSYQFTIAKDDTPSEIIETLKLDYDDEPTQVISSLTPGQTYKIDISSIILNVAGPITALTVTTDPETIRDVDTDSTSYSAIVDFDQPDGIVESYSIWMTPVNDSNLIVNNVTFEPPLNKEQPIHVEMSTGLLPGNSYNVYIQTRSNDKLSISEPVNVTLDMPVVLDYEVGTTPISVDVYVQTPENKLDYVAQVQVADENGVPVGDAIINFEVSSVTTFVDLMPETRYNISITPSRRGIKGIPVVTEITTDNVPKIENYTIEANLTTVEIDFDIKPEIIADYYELILTPVSDNTTEETTILLISSNYTSIRFDELNPDSDYQVKMISVYKEKESELVQEIVHTDPIDEIVSIKIIPSTTSVQVIYKDSNQTNEDIGVADEFLIRDNDDTIEEAIFTLSDVGNGTKSAMIENLIPKTIYVIEARRRLGDHLGNTTTYSVSTLSPPKAELQNIDSGPTSIDVQLEPVNITVDSYCITISSTDETSGFIPEEITLNGTDDELKHIFTGLIPGKEYEIQFFTKISGIQSEKNGENITTELPPFVDDVIFLPGYTSIVTNIISLDEESIDKYVIKVLNDDLEDILVLAGNATGVLEGLEPGKLYEIAVSSVIGNVTGLPLVKNVTTESIPIIAYNTSSTATSITVMIEPADAEILHYTVKINSTQSNETIVKDVFVDSDLLQVEFNNLTPSIPYDISVSAVVGDREGPPNVELVETMSPPQAELLEFVIGPTSIAVELEPSNITVDAYCITISPVDVTTTDTIPEEITLNGTDSELIHVFTELTPGKEYQINFFTKIKGVQSEKNSEIITTDLPPQPEEVTFSPDYTSILVNIISTDDDIDNYIVKILNDDDVVPVKIDPVNDTGIVERLEPGKLYEITVSSVIANVTSVPKIYNITTNDIPSIENWNITTKVSSMKVAIEPVDGDIESYFLMLIPENETNPSILKFISSDEADLIIKFDGLPSNSTYLLTGWVSVDGYMSEEKEENASTTDFIADSWHNWTLTSTSSSVNVEIEPYLEEAIDGYRVVISDPIDNEIQFTKEPWSNSTLKVTFDNLVSGTSYNVDLSLTYDSVIGIPVQGNVTTAPPAKPENLQVENVTATNVTVSWDADNSVEFYQAVAENLDNDNLTALVIRLSPLDGVDDVVYGSFDSLTPGSMHSITLTPYGADSIPGLESEIYIRTEPKAVESALITPNTRSLSITFEPASGYKNSYTVTIAKVDLPGDVISEKTVLEGFEGDGVQFDSLAPDEKYVFGVTTIAGNTSSEEALFYGYTAYIWRNWTLSSTSSSISVGIQPMITLQPIDGYVVSISEGADGNQTIEPIDSPWSNSSTSVTFGNLTAGAEYAVTLSVKYNESVGPSTVKMITTDIPLKPENLIEEDVTTTTILVSWDQDYSVHYYQAIIADGEDSVMSVQNFGDVMYGLAENLIPDTVHTITVIPYGKNDIAGPAVHFDIRTRPEKVNASAIVGVTLTSTSSSVTVTIEPRDPDEPIEQYKISIAEAAYRNEIIQTISAPYNNSIAVKTFNNLTSGTTYIVTTSVKYENLTVLPLREKVTTDAPMKPGSLRPENVSTRHILISWKQDPNVDSYMAYLDQIDNATKIQIIDDSAYAFIDYLDPVNDITYAFAENLTPGTMYKISVVPYGKNKIAGPSEEIDIRTIPRKVNATADAKITSVTVEFGPADGYKDQYLVMIAKNESKENIFHTEVVVPGTPEENVLHRVEFRYLEPGQSYVITVVTKAGNLSSDDDILTVNTDEYIWKNWTLSSSASSISVEIDPMQTEEPIGGYEISIAEMSNANETVETIDQDWLNDTTTVAFTNLTSGTPYIVSLSIKYNETTGPIVSKNDMTDPPLQPENLVTVDVTEKEILVSWERDYSVDHYRAFVNEVSGNELAVQIMDDIVFGFIEDLTSGTMHTIIVVPYGKNEIPGEFAQLDIRTLPDKVNASAEAGITSILVEFEPALGYKDGYEVTISKNATDDDVLERRDIKAEITADDTIAVLFDLLESNEQYVIKIVTISGNLSSEPTILSAKTEFTVMWKNWTLSSTSSSVSVMIAPADTAEPIDGYTVSIADVDNTDNVIEVLEEPWKNGTSAVTFLNLTSGTTYVVTLSVKYNEFTGPPATKNATTGPPLKPENLLAEEVNSTIILLSWDRNPSVYLYQAVLDDPDGVPIATQVIEDAVYGLAEDLTHGTVYKIIVIPFGKDGIPGPQAELSLRTVPGKVNATSSSDVSTITVEFGPASGYKDLYKITIAKNETKDVIIETQVIDAGDIDEENIIIGFHHLDPDQEYMIQIFTIAGDSSTVTDVSARTNKRKPVLEHSFNVNTTSSAMYISFLLLEGAEEQRNYNFVLQDAEIQEEPLQQKLYIATSNTALELEFEDLKAAKDYVVTVFVTDENENPMTNFSVNATTALPEAPKNLTVTEVSETFVGISWIFDPAVTSYDIDLKTREVGIQVPDELIQRQFRVDVDDNSTEISDSSISFRINNLIGGYVYDITLTPIGAKGLESAGPSDNTTARTVPHSVTFASINATKKHIIMRFTPAFGYKDQYNVTVKEKDGVVVDTVKVFPGDEQQTIVFGQNITKDQLYDIVITTEAGDLRSEPSIFQIKTLKTAVLPPPPTLPPPPFTPILNVTEPTPFPPEASTTPFIEEDNTTYTEAFTTRDIRTELTTATIGDTTLLDDTTYMPTSTLTIPPQDNTTLTGITESIEVTTSPVTTFTIPLQDKTTLTDVTASSEWTTSPVPSTETTVIPDETTPISFTTATSPDEISMSTLTIPLQDNTTLTGITSSSEVTTLTVPSSETTVIPDETTYNTATSPEEISTVAGTEKESFSTYTSSDVTTYAETTENVVTGTTVPKKQNRTILPPPPPPPPPSPPVLVLFTKEVTTAEPETTAITYPTGTTPSKRNRTRLPMPPPPPPPPPFPILLIWNLTATPFPPLFNETTPSIRMTSRHLWGKFVVNLPTGVEYSQDPSEKYLGDSNTYLTEEVMLAVGYFMEFAPAQIRAYDIWLDPGRLMVVAFNFNMSMPITSDFTTEDVTEVYRDMLQNITTNKPLYNSVVCLTDINESVILDYPPQPREYPATTAMPELQPGKMYIGVVELRLTKSQYEEITSNLSNINITLNQDIENSLEDFIVKYYSEKNDYITGPGIFDFKIQYYQNLNKKNEVAAHFVITLADEDKGKPCNIEWFINKALQNGSQPEDYEILPDSFIVAGRRKFTGTVSLSPLSKGFIESTLTESQDAFRTMIKIALRETFRTSTFPNQVERGAKPRYLGVEEGDNEISLRSKFSVITSLNEQVVPWRIVPLVLLGFTSNLFNINESSIYVYGSGFKSSRSSESRFCDFIEGTQPPPDTGEYMPATIQLHVEPPDVYSIARDPDSKQFFDLKQSVDDLLDDVFEKLNDSVSNISLNYFEPDAYPMSRIMAHLSISADDMNDIDLQDAFTSAIKELNHSSLVEIEEDSFTIPTHRKFIGDMVLRNVAPEDESLLNGTDPEEINSVYAKYDLLLKELIAETDMKINSSVKEVSVFGDDPENLSATVVFQLVPSENNSVLTPSRISEQLKKAQQILDQLPLNNVGSQILGDSIKVWPYNDVIGLGIPGKINLTGLNYDQIKDMYVNRNNSSTFDDYAVLLEEILSIALVDNEEKLNLTAIDVDYIEPDENSLDSVILHYKMKMNNNIPPASVSYDEISENVIDVAAEPFINTSNIVGDTRKFWGTGLIEGIPLLDEPEISALVLSQLDTMLESLDNIYYKKASISRIDTNETNSSQSFEFNLEMMYYDVSSPQLLENLLNDGNIQPNIIHKSFKVYAGHLPQPPTEIPPVITSTPSEITSSTGTVSKMDETSATTDEITNVTEPMYSRVYVGKVTFDRLPLWEGSADQIKYMREAILDRNSQSYKDLESELEEVFFKVFANDTEATVANLQYFEFADELRSSLTANIELISFSDDPSAIKNYLVEHKDQAGEGYSYDPETVQVSIRRTFFGEFYLLNMTNPSVDLVIQNSSDEDSLANVYFPVIKNKLLEVYGKQIWVQNTTTPGLLNYNIEDLEIIRMYFYEEDKTEVYFSITMELNEVADPFEMTDTFRYLLTNDNFVLYLDDGQPIEIDVGTFNITMLPEIEPPQISTYSGEISLLLTQPDLDWVIAVRDRNSREFGRQKMLTDDFMSKIFEDYLDNRIGIVTQYFAPYYDELGKVAGLTSHFQMNSILLDPNDLKMIFNFSLDNLNDLRTQYINDTFEIPTARKFFCEAYLNVSDEGTYNDLLAHRDKPFYEDSAAYSIINNLMNGIENITYTDDIVFDGERFEVYTTNTVKLIANVTMPINDVSDPFSMTANLRWQMGPDGYAAYGYGEVIVLDTSNVNITPYVSEQRFYTYNMELSFPILLPEIDWIEAARNESSDSFFIQKELTDEVLRDIFSDFIGDQVSVDVQYFSPYFNEVDSTVGLTSHSLLMSPLHKPEELHNAIIWRYNTSYNGTAKEFLESSVLVPTTRTFFYEAYLTPDDDELYEGLINKEINAFNSTVAQFLPLIQQDLRLVSYSSADLVIDRFEPHGKRRLKMVANITMPDNNMNDPFTLTSRIRKQETFLTSVLVTVNDTNDIFVILDPTTVNITTYVIPYNPDETQDVITGYFLIPDLKPEVVALLYNDSDSDVAKEIKDEILGPVEESNSEEPWLEDIEVEYFEQLPDGNVKVHFKAKLLPETNKTDEEIEDKLNDLPYAKDNYTIGEPRDFIGTAEMGLDPLIDYENKSSIPLQEMLDDLTDALEDSLDGNATVNITAVNPRDDDTVDVNFTVVADPNVPATAEDLQDTAREQFNPTDELPLNKDTIKIRVPGPYPESDPDILLSADTYTGSIMVNDIDEQDVIDTWINVNAEPVINMTFPLYSTISDLPFNVYVDYIEPVDYGTSKIHFFLDDFENLTSLVDVYLGMMYTSKENNYTLKNMTIGEERVFVGQVNMAGDIEEDEAIEMLTEIAGNGMEISVFKEDEKPDVEYWKSDIKQIISGYEDDNGSGIDFESGDGSTSAIYPLLSDYPNTLQFKIETPRNIRIMPSQLQNDMLIDLRDNFTISDWFDLDTFSVYVRPPKVRMIDYYGVLILDVIDPDSFPETKDNITDFIMDMINEALKNLSDQVDAKEINTTIYPDDTNEEKRNKVKIEFVISGPEPIMKNTTAPELEDLIRDPYPTLEFGYGKITSDKIFVDVFDPCLDDFKNDCDRNALCFGNITGQTFICECKTGFVDKSLDELKPGRICVVPERIASLRIVYILIILASLLLLIILVLVYAAYQKSISGFYSPKDLEQNRV